MSNRLPESSDTNQQDGDLFDRLMPLGRATSRLERSYGPSCMLSMVIVFILLLMVRRFLAVGWVGTGVLALILWYIFFAVLTRWRPGRGRDEDR